MKLFEIVAVASIICGFIVLFTLAWNVSPLASALGGACALAVPKVLFNKERQA